LAELFKMLENRVCVFQFSCRFSVYQLFIFKADTENNANLEARQTNVPTLTR